MKRMAVVLALLLLCGCGAAPPVEEACPASRESEVVQPTGYVALTFDDGPSVTHTPRLLDGLKARGVRATFFLVGYRLEGNEELVRRIKADGHQIGNHSYAHAQLDSLPAQEALADLTRCDLALCTLLGEGDYWVRPPYGLISEKELADLGVPVICWSVDPRDWERKNGAAIAADIVAAARDGDIILLHDCYASSVDAALLAVDALLERGLRPVTVEELLQRRGTVPAVGTIYHSAK